MKTFAVVMGAMFVMSAGACGKKAEGGGEAGKPAEGGAGGDLPATCQKYMDTVKKCLEKVPAEAKAAMESGFKQATDAWKQVPDKGALEATCKQMWDAAKGGMGAACPDVKWE